MDNSVDSDGILALLKTMNIDGAAAAGQQDWSDGKHFWVPDSEHVYVRALLVGEESDGRLRLRLPDDSVFPSIK